MAVCLDSSQQEWVVSTIPERCRRCYTCVRECPAKAIRVEGGQAQVLQERCVACGNCVRVCAQRAKRIIDCVPRVERMLEEGGRVFACLAPSFPAAFHPVSPGKIIAAIRKLGFYEVWEVALGAEIIGHEYSRLIKESREQGKQLIASSCPALVAFVEKHMPSLVPALAPVLSPMVAVAKAIRRRHGNGVRIVFIGPCLAKKNEFRDPSVAGVIDAVLTFEELLRLFERAGVVPAHLRESFFDSPRCHLARSFPLSGGLLKTAGHRADVLDNDVVVTEGKDRVLAALREVETGRSEARLFDVLLCDGCINGPVMPNDLSVFTRKEIVANFVNEQSRRTTEREVVEGLAEFADLELRREFSRRDLRLDDPSEEEIAEALRKMKKALPEDRLNCGACGYRTCREKAVAVCQGLAESEMCLPYLVEELQQTCADLRISHDELAAAQRRLVQTERLASMGQLSAGVAHEINNPLGVVLIYSHLLLKNLKEADPQREDLETIVREATRCRNIVRGLLDFARQSRVSKGPTDLASLVRDVADHVAPKLEARGGRILLEAEVQPGLPVMMLDATQIKQMLVNLVENGIDAIPEAGRIKVGVRMLERGDAVEIRVSDDGVGIPEANLPKLFTPFYTTKEPGKGTGLGLAICYGVVKMHCGDITADSDEGRGTTFTVTLPVEQGELEAGPPGQ